MSNLVNYFHAESKDGMQFERIFAAIVKFYSLQIQNLNFFKTLVVE